MPIEIDFDCECLTTDEIYAKLAKKLHGKYVTVNFVPANLPESGMIPPAYMMQGQVVGSAGHVIILREKKKAMLHITSLSPMDTTAVIDVVDTEE